MTSTDHARNKTTAKDLLFHSGSGGFVVKIPAGNPAFYFAHTCYFPKFQEAGIRRSPTPQGQRTSLRGA